MVRVHLSPVGFCVKAHEGCRRRPHMCEPHKRSLFGHDTDVSSIANVIHAYKSKLLPHVFHLPFAHKLYLENCIHENISKRKEFINLNEHVKIETSSNVREYVTRDTSSI